MPARVSSSVHGSRPGERDERFRCWQLFVADPMFTNSAPPGPSAMLLDV
jgi:hypothetical protein